MRIRKIVSLVLALLVMAGLFAALPVAALAEETTTVTLGAGALTAGNKVWFGSYSSSPVLWRVLQSGDGKALLISNDTLDKIMFNQHLSNGNAWSGSNAQSWCSSFYTNWPDGIEKDAILATSVEEENNQSAGSMQYYYQGGYQNGYRYGAAPLNNEHFFFLSAKEADTLFTNDDDRKASGADSWWWLRSSNTHYSERAGVVENVGWVKSYIFVSDLGARPAFNINLNSVLFSSLISSSSNQYKLTLYDSAMTIAEGTGGISRSGNTVKVPYTLGGDHAGTASRVALLITGKDDTWTVGTGWSSGAAMQYYETQTVTAGGSATFNLPDSLADKFCGTDYAAYLLAVDECGDQQSDYASAPVAVMLPDSTTYPLWIGGTRVTEKNRSKLSDNHWSYAPSTHVLTLSGYTYLGQGYVYDSSGKGAAIYYNGTDALTVSLSGENHITPNGTNSSDCGIVNDTNAALTFSGSGSLLIDSVGNFKYYSSAVYSPGTVIFSGGSFKLGNSDADYGVRVNNGSYVVIEDSVSSFEAKGYLAAVNGPVRNAVAGTGYDMYQTRAGRLNISTEGAALTYTSGLQTKNYQKATFPVEEYTVVFNPGDGSGNMDPVTISEGEKLKLPACTFTPPKDDNGNDKAFNWWEVSGADGIYYVDGEVLIANNCAWDGVVTVTAKWKAKTAASILVDAEGQELDYSDAAQVLLSQNGVAFGGTMVYAFGENGVTAPTEGWNAALPQQTNAGTYYIWYKVAGNDEHFDSEAKCTTAKIRQAAAHTILDVTAELVYTVTSVSASAAGKMPDDAGTLTYTAGSAKKTGNVTVSDFAVDSSGNVTATLSGGAAGDTVTLPVTIGSVNYADSTVNVKITLTPKNDAGVTISGVPTQAITYGDADFMLTGSVTDAGTGTGTWTFSTSDNTVFQITPDGAAVTVKILKAGSATITAKYESDTTVDTETTDTITVNTKTLTIAAKDQSIYVGDAVPTLSGADFYTVTGLVGEEALTTAPTLAYQKAGSAVAPDNTVAGTYDIVPSGASAGDNYTISYETGTLTISDKGVQTISAENVTVTYGETGRSVIATVTSPATGGGEISYAVKDGSGDYIDVDASTGALTIKKVGTATVIATAAETSTYAQAAKDVTVTIDKANSSAATVTANNRTYDGTEQPLVTVSGEAVGGTMKYALGADAATAPATGWNTAVPAATSAGTYYTWYEVAGDENHNDVAPACAAVTISTKAMGCS